MTDDIVSRLYDLCLCCRCGCEQQCSDCEAADEIERLRKELRDLQIAYAKDTDELEKELTVTKFQLAYWREIALENQTNG